MNTSSESRWYVVQTHANSEAKAAHHLQRQGYGIYLPRYLKRRRHARKVEIVPAPVFPRYMFVAIDATAQRWRSIQSTIGVLRLVKYGEAPASVSGYVVEAMRRREDDKGFIKMDSRPAFKPGDSVRVLSGAFTDVLGLFEGMGDRERVAILLDLLGRKVRVLLDVDMVVAN